MVNTSTTAATAGVTAPTMALGVGLTRKFVWLGGWVSGGGWFVGGCGCGCVRADVKVCACVGVWL